MLRVVPLLLILAGCGGLPPTSPLEPGEPPDAGTSADAGELPPPVTFDCTPALAPTKLSETCLYEDLATQTLAPDLLTFKPNHELWSDGTTKRRWLRLPAGKTIDTSDMDHWRFPVGTQVFKEFSKDGVLLETRLVQINGSSAADVLIVAFVWNADDSDALATTAKQSNVKGTPHDVPSAKNCVDCHQGEPGRVLGVSALQLSGASELSYSGLAEAGRLSHRPIDVAPYAVPGNATEAAALGYLHANCGHCHAPTGMAWEHVKMTVRLGVAERSVTDSALYKSTVGVATSHFLSTRTYRIAPGAAASGEFDRRMGSRNLISMPPLGTEVVDAAGLAAVRAWINSL